MAGSVATSHLIVMNTVALRSRGAQLTRRTFIQHSAQAAAGVAAPFVPRRRVLGANDRIGVGFIGVGGRGRSHLRRGKPGIVL